MDEVTDPVPPTGTRQTSVERFMEDSARRILSIRLLQSVGATLPTSSRPLRWYVRPAGAAALICLTPILLELLLYSYGDREIWTNRRALLALGYFLVLDLFCFWCPYYIWHRLIGLSPEVDKALVNPQESSRIVQWIERESSMRWWSLYAGLGLACAAISMTWLDDRLAAEIPFGAGSHLAIFITAVVGIENMKWVLRLPTLSNIVVRSEIRTYWHDPASTPILQSMMRLVGATALLGLIGGAGIGIPVIWAYSFERSLSVGFIALLVAVILVAVFLITGLFPQYVAYRAVVRSKTATLNELIRRLPEPTSPLASASSKEVVDDVQLWRLIADAPTWIVTRDTVIQYGAAIFATSIATLVALLVA